MADRSKKRPSIPWLDRAIDRSNAPEYFKCARCGHCRPAKRTSVRCPKCGFDYFHAHSHYKEKCNL
jgi:Zn finger protein HypA/HybF involved in hydrogenase expression